MVLHHARRQHIQQCLVVWYRLVAMIQAGAQRERRTKSMTYPEFVGIDVFPAKTGAIGCSKEGTCSTKSWGYRRKWGANGGYVRIIGALNIERDRGCRRGFDRDAHTIVGRYVEAALVGKQAAVFAELAHLGLALVGRTQRHEGGDFAGPAYHENVNRGSARAKRDKKRCKNRQASQR